MIRPDVRYARASDGVAIAYAEIGDGPVTIVLLSPLISQLEIAWEEPRFEQFMSRLATCAKVVMFDRRGTGLSDHATASGERLDLETMAADVLALLDATDTASAVLFGVSLGAMLAVQFASDHPERTQAVITFGGPARLTRAPDFELGMDAAALDGWVDLIVRGWGTGISVDGESDRVQADPRFRAFAARLERHSAAPGMVAAALRRCAEFDVRPALPSLTVPALVMHRTEDRTVPVEQSRYLAANIPSADYVELEGEDHTYFLGDQDAVLDALISFIDRRLAGGQVAATVQRARRRSAFGYGWESLTPPEREIAALAASGMTTRAIAETLRMSRHTVDGRLRRVFAKLDVTTRVELAGEYARAGN